MRLRTLFLFLYAVLCWSIQSAAAAEVTLAWDASPDSRVVGYRLYYGHTSGVYGTTVDVGSDTRYTLTQLEDGITYYFAVAAYDGSAQESRTSNEIQWTSPVSQPPPPVCPTSTYTLWPDSAVPANPADSDRAAVELGVRFTAASAGWVCGIRFYKARSNTGLHVGSLWSGSGQLLAQATFSAETPAGWQQVTFATPVAIAAASVYVASYHAPNGHYAGDPGYFQDGGVRSGPLHALQSVYQYGNGGFPSASWQASNYWVDVVFAPDPASPPAPAQPVAQLHAGTLAVTPHWQRVNFTTTYQQPILLAKPLDYTVGLPGSVQIRRLDSTGFDIRSRSWDYLQDAEIVGQVSYLVLEAGSYTLADGTRLEAGQIISPGGQAFAPVEFAQPFNRQPVVITSVVSSDDPTAVTTRIRRIDTQHFELALQEQEIHRSGHGAETVAYLAWEPASGTLDGLRFEVGRTLDEVTHAFYPLTFRTPFPAVPWLLADMQSSDGLDTATLRYQHLTPATVELKVEEEQSRDAETRHSSERVGYVLLLPVFGASP